MALQYLAGQRLTADALQRAVPDRVVQAVDQDVTSSTAHVASSIVIEVDGLLKIDLEIRYTSGGGGIRWNWSESAGVTFVHRAAASSGSATSGSQTNVADMYWRSFSAFNTVTNSNHLNTFTTNRGAETLVVDGSGTLTLTWAQDVSNAAATTLFANSYALVSRLGS